MRIFLAISILFGMTGTAAYVCGQTEFVSGKYFPADHEFVELRSIESEQVFDQMDSLGDSPERALFAEVGFRGYASRTYVLVPSGQLTIETVTLKDAKAAYSLLTLLRNAPIEKGPPGDLISSGEDTLVFSQANILVRIKGGTQGDLARRIARSVSNRIGRHEPPPQLVGHFPKTGFDPSSLRYYLGPTSFARYGESLPGKELPFRDELEIAQAHYSLGDERGVLSLVGFPTIPLAEEYFAELFGTGSSDPKSRQPLYFKRTGPLVGILTGEFDPRNADRVLGSIEFTYSIKWIFDINNRGGGIWGASGGLLGTVVRSLLFTGLLGAISLFTGVFFAAFRLLLRGYAPNNFLDRPDRTALIRLKINEK